MEYVVWIALVLQVGAFAILARRLTRQVRRRTAAPGEEEARARARSEELSRREARLVELYGGVEALMDVFEGYLEEVSREIEAERASLRALTQPAAVPEAALQPEAPTQMAALQPEAALQMEALQPEAALQMEASQPEAPAQPEAAPLQRETAPEPPEAAAAAPSRLSEPDRAALVRCGAKSQKVRFLLGRGLSVDEAARELGIGKGEARLIAALERSSAE